MFPPDVQSVIDRVDALRHEVTDHWQIPADEARVLAQLVRAARCRSVFEIGTSYGFSTLHLAAAGRDVGGHVHSVDPEAYKTEAASRHLREAGLAEHVTLHTADAQDVLPSVEPDAPFDLAFIDAKKSECFDYLARLWPKLAPHCLIATDNTDTHWEELRPFVEHLHGLDGCVGANVPVGNGFDLTVRR